MKHVLSGVALAALMTVAAPGWAQAPLNPSTPMSPSGAPAAAQPATPTSSSAAAPPSSRVSTATATTKRPKRTVHRPVVMGRPGDNVADRLNAAQLNNVPPPMPVEAGGGYPPPPGPGFPPPPWAYAPPPPVYGYYPAPYWGGYYRRRGPWWW